MGNLFTEIRKFKKFSKINEGFSPIKTAMFGDELIYFLYDDDIDILKNLTAKYQTMNQLILDMETMVANPTYDHVFFSIGTDDKFENYTDIATLSKSVRRIFPNANLYVIRAIVDEDYFYSETEDEVIKNLELQIDNFYKQFQKYNIKVVGSYNSVDYGLGITKQKMNVIKNEIAKHIIEDITDINPELEDNKMNEPFVDVTNKKIEGDDETDFDTIYEFLERFEDIYKSGNVYSKRINSSYKLDVEQIQIALNFVLRSNIEITGKYDLPTENEVIEYQKSKGLDETGLCDSETLEELFYDLKIKGFEDDDLSYFLRELGVVSDTIEKIVSSVDLSRAGLSSEQRANVQVLIKKMIENGITNPYTQIGILSTIGKESGFVPKNEICYNDTSDSRIKDVFDSCRTNETKIKRDWDRTLTELKEDCDDFFDAMYGKKAEVCLGFDTGNDEPGDGYRYRGRGFNGITFKTGYKKWSNATGIDLVSDPDKLNDVNVAAEVAVLFFTKGRNIPDFTNKKDATDYFVNINAGGSTDWSEAFDKAYNWMEKFEAI
jgi:predicted chitinase